MSEVPQSQKPAASWLLSRTGLVACGFLLAIGFLIATGHGAHLLGVAPYFLLLACPLMHLFMHGKHNLRNKGSDQPESDGHDSISKPSRKDSQGCH